ncbi:hypothetical protein Tco_0319620 [Tanacetum coccineum]
MAVDSQEVVSKPSSSNYDLNIIDLLKENEVFLKFNKYFSKTFEKRSLENENSKLSSKINDLEIEVKKLANVKEVVEPCQKCVELTQEVDSLKNNVSKLQGKALYFSKFKKSSIVLDDTLSHQNCPKIRFSQTSKAYIMLNKETMIVEESLNVTFDESLPEPKSSSSVEDDRIEFMVRVMEENGRIREEMELKRRSKLKLKAS